VRPITRSSYGRALCVSAWLVTAAGVSADVVVTMDGSRIVGTLERFSSEGAVIATGFAGTLTIAADKVASIVTDEPVIVAAQSGDRLVGRVTEQPDGDGMIVESEIGEVPIAREKVADVWPKGADSPETLAQKKAHEKQLAAVTPTWSTSLQAGINRQEGNNDRLEGNGRLDITRKTSRDKLNFFLWGRYGEQNDRRTDNEYGGGVRFDALITERLGWYTRLRLEHDEFEDLDLRATVAGGLSYYWIKKEEHTFQTGLGLGYRHEEYMTPGRDTTKSAVFDAGFDYMIVMAPWATYTWEFDYTPDIEEYDDYRIWSDMGLTFPLKNDNLAFKLGLRHQYNSRPSRGNENLDTTYYANVVLTFKN